MRKRGNAITYALLSVMALVAAFPIVYTFTNSFMGAGEMALYYGRLATDELAVNPFHPIPDWITFSSYFRVFLERPDYLMKFWQSLGLCLVIVAGQVLVSSLGGFAFAKHRFPGRSVVFFFLIALMMMPNQVMLVPSYIALDWMGLIGSDWALILPLVFSAFGVFLLSQIMAGVPDELLESAKVDGAGHFTILTRIMLPNCKAGLASLVILGFIDVWNMVEQPLVFIRETYRHPFSLFLLQINASEPALGFACGILAMLPVFLLFKFFEDEMISGISYSVLK